MTARAFNLAIETSGRSGSIALGRGDELLATADLPPARRHNVALTPAIDRLCRAHEVRPADLAEVYVSLGPGSFTGLRVAVATVKMLALAQPLKVVGVPTLAVLACNAPDDAAHVAPCLNLRRQTVYCAVYGRSGEVVVEPAPRTLAELLAASPRPVTIVGDPLPPLPDEARDADDVTVLGGEHAVARAEHVWRLGRRMAQRGEEADPMTLVPLYVRPPEAVELWNQRHGAAPASRAAR